MSLRRRPVVYSQEEMVPRCGERSLAEEDGRTLGLEAGSGFRGFVFAVVQISVLSLIWVFLEHINMWVKAKIATRGGDLRVIPGMTQMNQPPTATATQTAPPRTFWGGGASSTAAPTQRDFNEFR